jgi:hypothetical protein
MQVLQLLTELIAPPPNVNAYNFSVQTALKTPLFCCSATVDMELLCLCLLVEPLHTDLCYMCDTYT